MSDLIEELLEIPEFEKPKSFAEKEWEGMPEYNNKDLTRNYSVIMSFRCFEDALEFANLIGQKITPKTKSMWYPEFEIVHVGDKRYINES